MPFVEKLGISAEIQSGGNLTNPDVFTPLVESNCEDRWKHDEGTPYPIYITTVKPPAKGEDIPMKLVVEYKEPEDHPSYMKGDTRIHVMVDGIEAGIKYIKSERIRLDKGWKNEFSGFRVGRCQERLFVFNPLPAKLGTESHADGCADGDGGGNGEGDIWNSSRRHVMGLATTGNYDPTPMTGELCRAGEAKPYSVCLPPHISAILVTITLGRVHATVDKYAMYGAIQPPGLYFPPQPDPDLFVLSPQDWKPMVGPDAPDSVPIVQIKKKGKWVPSTDPGRSAEKAFATAKDPESWRPIGLGEGEVKIKQTKEIQFTARMHLVRFWFFVVAPPPSGNDGTAAMWTPDQMLGPLGVEEQQGREYITPDTALAHRKGNADEAKNPSKHAEDLLHLGYDSGIVAGNHPIPSNGPRSVGSAPFPVSFGPAVGGGPYGEVPISITNSSAISWPNVDATLAEGPRSGQQTRHLVQHLHNPCGVKWRELDPNRNIDPLLRPHSPANGTDTPSPYRIPSGPALKEFKERSSSMKFAGENSFSSYQRSMFQFSSSNLTHQLGQPSQDPALANLAAAGGRNSNVTFDTGDLSPGSEAMGHHHPNIPHRVPQLEPQFGLGLGIPEESKPFFPSGFPTTGLRFLRTKTPAMAVGVSSGPLSPPSTISSSPEPTLPTETPSPPGSADPHLKTGAKRSDHPSKWLPEKKAPRRK